MTTVQIDPQGKSTLDIGIGGVRWITLRGDLSAGKTTLALAILEQLKDDGFRVYHTFSVTTEKTPSPLNMFADLASWKNSVQSVLDDSMFDTVEDYNDEVEDSERIPETIVYMDMDTYDWSPEETHALLETLHGSEKYGISVIFESHYGVSASAFFNTLDRQSFHTNEYFIDFMPRLVWEIQDFTNNETMCVIVVRIVQEYQGVATAYNPHANTVYFKDTALDDAFLSQDAREATQWLKLRVA